MKPEYTDAAKTLKDEEVSSAITGLCCYACSFGFKSAEYMKFCV